MNAILSQPNRRILVIDDNRAIHDDFRKILGEPDTSALAAGEARLFGRPVPNPFQVDSAYQGQEALAMVQQALAEDRPYAMTFLDMRMPPGWDGIETAKKIWAVYPDLQVVICTAYSVLERRGYRVIEAASGIEALDKWDKNGPEVDLLLTDMVMPDGLTGRQLAKQLQVRKPELKIIHTSGYTMNMEGTSFVTREGRNFLQKPYRPDHLFKALRECLDQKS